MARVRRKATAARDLLLWAVLCLPLLWGGRSVLLADRYTPWEIAAGAAAIGAAVALGRSRPLPAMLVTAALWLAAAGTGKAVGCFPALAVMSYLAGLRVPRVRPALIALGAGTAAAVLAVPVLSRDTGDWFVTVAGIALFGVVPWLAGHARHQHLELVRAGWERAERLEREQRAVAEQVRLRERARIAGDMHDLLGHELSLVALRIGALEVAPDLAERHREIAGQARSAVTAAAGRLREIVEVLRDDTAPDPVRHGVADLVERARAAGMDVELHGPGEDGLAPMAGQAVRRVVQEGLTNAAKHAAGAPVTVRLDRTADETVVTVVTGLGGPPPRAAGTRAAGAGPADPGRPGNGAGAATGAADPGGAGPGGGYGLVGLAERVRLCGGSLHAGERAGGFELTARLPRVPGPVRDVPVPSADHLRRARRRVRRTRAVALTAALLTVIGTAAAVVGYTAYDAAASVLSPAGFGRLRTGMEQAAVEALLPARTRIDGPAVGEPPVPAGARCRYYGTHADPFGARGGELYRLCFAGGRLVGKDFLPVGRVP
ncbi:histidine kinase [Streptosporangium sandarakinum]